MRDSKPKRVRPAHANTMASISPASCRRRRVSTLPRKVSILRSGRAASNCACRRRLEVPTRHLSGRPSRPAALAVTSASRASARSSTAAMVSPWANSPGRSFIECTAMSARCSVERHLELFDEQALPADGGQSPVLNSVALGHHGHELDFEAAMRLAQQQSRRARPARVPAGSCVWRSAAARPASCSCRFGLRRETAPTSADRWTRCPHRRSPG